jgi:His/Glu/Gln/Arg/opine family amino acid ABC transporter permease subunit
LPDGTIDTEFAIEAAAVAVEEEKVRNGWALWSLVFGIAGTALTVAFAAVMLFRDTSIAKTFLGVGGVTAVCAAPGVVALVLAEVSRQKIKRGEYPFETARLATAGLTLGLIGLLGSLAVLLLYLGRFRIEALRKEFLNPRILRDAAPYLLKGFVITLKLAFVSEACILVLGLIVALVRISRFKFLRFLAAAYIDVIRGMPLILQIVIIYFGLSYLGLNLDRFTAGVLALTLCYAAYEAEIFRAGIESIHKGQMEAARSLGMGYLQSMRYVVLPQAVRRVIPPLSNEFIALLKDTALVSVIALMEVFMVGREQMGRFANVTPLVGVAICYLVLTLPLMRLVQYVEKKLARGD